MNFIHLKKAKFRKVNKDLFFEQDESFEPKWRQKLEYFYSLTQIKRIYEMFFLRQKCYIP